MSSFKKLSFLVSGIALAFSGSLSAQTAVNASTAPLAFTETQQFISGPCEQDQCGQLQIATIQFNDQAAVSNQITQRLLSMASSLSEKKPGFDSVPAVLKNFELNATSRTNEILRTDVLRSQNNLIVVNLEHYIDTGGAHGEPSSQYVNWIPGQAQPLTLEAILLPKQQNAFDARLKAQYERWLADQVKQGNVDDTEEFAKTWPFKTTDNVALMHSGLTATFSKYVLGPGFLGQPSLTIPYSELRGILKPEYLQLAQQ